MAEPVTVSAPVSGRDLTLSFESGRLAPQADGAVLARIGDTNVLVTATMARSVREGQDFFPLTVDIEERMYAAGKIPGSFFRREGRATDQAILTCRLIDRPLRPSFPEGFRNEVHVVGTVFGADLVNPHDVLAINAASGALMVSGIPFDGPIGAVRLAYSTVGEWITHPTYEERDAATFELVVAGRGIEGDDVAIMMVEASGSEGTHEKFAAGAPLVTEDVIVEGLEFSKIAIRESIELQRQLVEKVGAKPTPEFPVFVDYGDDVMEAVSAQAKTALDAAAQIAGKAERNEATDAATNSALEALSAQFEGREREIVAACRSLQKKLIRSRIVNEGVRIDGRAVDELRQLSAEVGLIPTAHGSGLFQRGETQVLNFTTIGMPRMEQMLDSIGTEESKRYMHHYNMPPFSTGETGFMRGPKRREIGHGILAERALLPVIPGVEEFPSTLRLVSEVLSSNGSTSMASVCSSSLSLMDAGVPIKAAVAGIAMGLVYEDGKYTPLTDILGAEDAFGDMDFKVAGTENYVTALQLDTKIDGLPAEVLGRALAQAKDARLQILAVMRSAISEPRSEVAAGAPKIVSLEIPLDKIGEVIGPKGKVINTLQQETGADISVDDDGVKGTVTIGAKLGSAVDDALSRIQLIINPPRPEVGATYEGKVVNITTFGAFVNILPGRDGLLHISKLGQGRRVDRVEDVLSLDQAVTVIVEDIDPKGKVALRLVGGSADSEEGAQVASKPAGREPREARPTRDEGSSGDSFSDFLDAELAAEFGDLGPKGDRPSTPSGPRNSQRRNNRRR